MDLRAILPAASAGVALLTMSVLNAISSDPTDTTSAIGLARMSSLFIGGGIGFLVGRGYNVAQSVQKSMESKMYGHHS
jgi:hypothetical protein